MQDDELITLVDAAELFPKRDGKALSRKAIRRRIQSGIRGVRLKAIRDGGEWFTTREWVEQFVDAITDRALRKAKVAAPSPSKTPERVRRLLAKRYGINVATTTPR